MTERQTVADIVRAVIVEQIGIEAELVTPDATLSSDLGADSLDFVCIVMDLEERLGIDIPDLDVADFATVGAVVTYLEQRGA